MKNFRWIFILFIFLSGVSTSYAEEFDEAGEIYIQGYICRYKHNAIQWQKTKCGKESVTGMNEKHEEIMSCYTEYMRQCHGQECKDRIKHAVSYCCRKTGGNISD